MMDEPIPGSKKRRLQGSCDNCRTRKIRCDSASRPGNKCSNCITFDLQCTHVAAMSRKNRGLPVNLNSWDTTTVIDDLKTHIDSILSESVPYTPSKDKRVADALVKELARYARSLEQKLEAAERRLAQLSSASSSASTPASGPDTSPRASADHLDPDPVHLMEAPLNRLQISDERSRFGASKDAKLIHSASALKNELDPTLQLRRPSFWYVPKHPWQYLEVVEPRTLMFPAADLLDDLVKIFLRYFNQHFHILHGPSFVRQVAAGLHHTTPAFGSVVLAVCAMASRYSDDPRVGEGHHKGWNYYTQIKAIHLGQYLDPKNLLWDLQLFPLMGLYAYSLTLPDQCFLLTAMGIRLAQARHIHRLKRTEDKPWTTHDELLKRTWWLLVVLDTYVSSFGGHRRVTDYEEFDAEYPLEVDDEFWPGEPLADPERPWHQPKRTNCRVSGWVYHLKLLSIYSFAQTTIYTIRRSPYWDCIGCPDWDRNIVVELDSALNVWLDSLPDFLRWDPHSPTADAAMLQSTLHFIQIQIHRPFLREFASNAICVTAARSCSHVLASYSKGWPFLTMPMAFGWALYSSILLLLNVKDGKLASPRDLEDVAENMEMLSRHEGAWQVAGRYHDVIRELYQLLKMPAPIDNVRKRKSGDDDQADVLLPTEMESFPDLTFDTGMGGDAAGTWEGLDIDAWHDPQVNNYLNDLSGWGDAYFGSFSQAQGHDYSHDPPLSSQL